MARRLEERKDPKSARDQESMIGSISNQRQLEANELVVTTHTEDLHQPTELTSQEISTAKTVKAPPSVDNLAAIGSLFWPSEGNDNDEPSSKDPDLVHDIFKDEVHRTSQDPNIRPLRVRPWIPYHIAQALSSKNQIYIPWDGQLYPNSYDHIISKDFGHQLLWQSEELGVEAYGTFLRVEPKEATRSDTISDSGYGSVVETIENLRCSTMKALPPNAESSQVSCRLQKFTCKPITPDSAVSLYDSSRRALSENSTNSSDHSFGKSSVPEKMTECLPRKKATHSEHSVPISNVNKFQISVLNDNAYVMGLQVKHQLLVSLMREFYAMFDYQWSSNVRGHAGTEANKGKSNSPLQAGRAGGESSSARSNGKRRAQENDSPPSEDERGKKSRKTSVTLDSFNQRRRLACPLHKYDPSKYCVNGNTGATYRTCSGPGFQTMAQVKQHLRLKHRSPLQCHRCWVVMANSEQMRHHVTQEICPILHPQPEGIHQEKLDLIDSKRGASWGEVFEILFPGAPIPNQYFDAQDHLSQTRQWNPPGLQNFEDFESYSRLALPLLIEANFRAAIDANLLDVQESIRTSFLDVVRSCQSMVAENFRLMRTRSGEESVPDGSSSQAPILTKRSFSDSAATVHPSPDALSADPILFFQEPQFLSEDASASTLQATSGDQHNFFPPNIADSGYESFYRCSCHTHTESSTSSNPEDQITHTSESRRTLSGVDICESCQQLTCEWGFDFGGVSNL